MIAPHVPSCHVALVAAICIAGLEDHVCHYKSLKECKLEAGKVYCNATQKLIDQGLAEVSVGACDFCMRRAASV